MDTKETGLISTTSPEKTGTEKANEELSKRRIDEEEKGKLTGEKHKQTKKIQSPSTPSSSSKFSILKFLRKSPSKEEKSDMPNPRKKGATKTKKGGKTEEKKQPKHQVEEKTGKAQGSSSKEKDDKDKTKRHMVQSKLGKTKDGIEIVSSPEQPEKKVQRKKSGRKSRSTQSSGKEDKKEKKKQTKISSLFPVRKSTRRCKSEQQKEENAKISQAILSKKQEGLEVRDIEDKGRGVFATRPFEKNEFVCEYAGELISYDEAKKREERYSDDEDIGCYMYYIQFNDKKYCIDATEEDGTFGRLLNHSRTGGNCKTRLHAIEDVPHLILVTIRDVEKGEELTYDYGDRSKQAIESHPWLKY